MDEFFCRFLMAADARMGALDTSGVAEAIPEPNVDEFVYILETAAKMSEPRIEALSAITLATRDMARAVRFYEALGFPLKSGGPDCAFTSFAFGNSFLNLIAEASGPINWWGRVIFHVSDVDAIYRKALAAGLAPAFAPCDAPWGERYFHMIDPDGHELSFARPLG